MTSRRVEGNFVLRSGTKAYDFLECQNTPDNCK